MARIDHIQVQLLFLKRGSEAVEKLIDDEKVSAHTLRRALDELASDPDVGSGDLEDMLNRRGFLSSPLLKPDVGQTRGYKSYEVDGSQYIRLNVTHLGEETGSVLPCRFGVDDIRVVRPQED